MDFVELTRWVAIIGLVICVAGIGLKINSIMNRPFKQDKSRARGNVGRAVLFAFTLGMAPWEKESTRLHWVAYFRGILFHVGIFTAFAVLFATPWLASIPAPLLSIAAAVTGLGALFGFGGIWMRLAGENERTLSVPDDYASVFLSSLFTALACIVTLLPTTMPIFYLVTAVMLVYIPFSKIRHCVYFFYAKFFFGMGFGHRGVIGQPKSEYSD